MHCSIATGSKMSAWQLLPIVTIFMLLQGTESLFVPKFDICIVVLINVVLLIKIGCSTLFDRRSCWSCGDGYYVQRDRVCDGSFDCLNGKDEFNCGEC